MRGSGDQVEFDHMVEWCLVRRHQRRIIRQECSAFGKAVETHLRTSLVARATSTQFEVTQKRKVGATSNYACSQLVER